MCIITGAGACIQTKQLMPALSMSNANLSYRNCGCCVHERIFLLLFAVLWAFSVRFGYIMAPVPFAEVLTASFVLAEGRKQLRDQPSLVGELRRQSVIILVQVMLCIVYPVSIYDSTQMRRPRSSTANDQIWNAKRCSLVDQPFGGVHACVTLFSVGVLNALYLSKCMQSASSRVTYLIIMTVDLLKM